MSGEVHTVRDLIGIEALEKVLLLVLASHADESGVAWPSNERLAATTGMSDRSVKRKLDVLEEKGLIRRLYSVNCSVDGRVRVTHRKIQLTHEDWPHRIDPNAKFDGISAAELAQLKADRNSLKVATVGLSQEVVESVAEPLGPKLGPSVQQAVYPDAPWSHSPWAGPNDPQNNN